MNVKHNVVYFKPEEWVTFRENTGFQLGSTGKIVNPRLETFLGSIRTAYLKKNNVNLTEGIPVDIKRTIGDSESSGRFKLIGPFFFKDNKHYFPVPKNLYKIKNDEDEKTKYGLINPHTTYKSEFTLGNQKINLNVPWIPLSKKEAEPLESELIELKELEEFKNGKVENPNLIKINELAETETKVGIALEKNVKKTQEGMLYSIKTYRFKQNAGFFFFIDETTKDLLEGLDEVRLGMKSKIAKLRISNVETTLFDNTSQGKTALCLLTDTIFDGGFMPLNKEIGGSEIISAITGKKKCLSGWDLEKKQPKPIIHAVPAGSVYFLNSAPKLKDLEEGISYKRNDFGYGRFFTMNWNFVGGDIDE